MCNGSAANMPSVMSNDGSTGSLLLTQGLEDDMKKRVGDSIQLGNSQPEIKAIAELQTPIPDYEPVLMLVEHENGDTEIYFPYYKLVASEQRFANRPPCFDEDVWLGLLTNAVRKGFFTRDFLKNLALQCIHALA